eukprot:CAMPEP_0194725620 /NCGR_PEP_ID=MMETSP0296-20130528/27788_1 /TAXON_ID=39354 /ORGANISM="Heterosigma akashiwo, Strain CCMP2393" /LENGTH=606 /DNA_ID=CAMNT_0039630175 /DNA_START=35 /DNA_END=1855 /DNA_ORIENTATION=+
MIRPEIILLALVCLCFLLNVSYAFVGPSLRAPSKIGRESVSSRSSLRMEVFEGNPVGKWAWNNVWKLPLFKRGEQGAPILFGDSAYVLKKNIEQIYGGEPSVDGCQIAEGDVSEDMGDTVHLGLYKYYDQMKKTYKLCFGPKSFLVISDPISARHVLRDNTTKYDKGMLAELLDPIMGKGLIPADQETWKVRRRAIVPGFHQAWLQRMVQLFNECNMNLVDQLEGFAERGEEVDMEEKFCSVSLDIIGKSVFNYDFGSVTQESPIVKAVYTLLKEVEHRSQIPLPYWDLPGAGLLVPRLRRFNADLRMLNDVLDELVARALATKDAVDLEELQARNYDAVSDPSLLRFLVDLRGEDATGKQLRDDLMTMLIAGHETTASVLTWVLFEVAQQPELLRAVQAEVDAVVGDRPPTMEDIRKLELVRLCIAESLRKYPEPPLLIRRALTDDELPESYQGHPVPVMRGMDLFISVYNIHHNPDFWEKPFTYDPYRFKRPASNPAVRDWAGYNPEAAQALLYPNEVVSDFAFLPFGGGARKCVGDQFATLEAVCTLALVFRRFEFRFAAPPETVGQATGATIHTKNGLRMFVKKRVLNEPMSQKEVKEMQNV